MFGRLRGQSLVELALIAPILILIIVVILDLGRIFTTWVAVTNSAREAAYWGSQSIAGSIPDASIRSVAAAEGSGARILADATHVAVAYPSPDLILVTVRSPFQPVAPGVGGLWAGGAPWISARAAFPVPLATPTALPITPSTPIPSSTPTATPTPTSPATSTPTGTVLPTNTTSAGPSPTPSATGLPTATRTLTATPAIVLVNSAGAAVSAGSVSVTLSSAPVQGNLLVAIVSANNSSTLTLAGWSVALDASGQNVSQAIFYKIAGASESATMTATRTGGGAIGIQVFQYSGMATSNPLDQTATGTAAASISNVNGTFSCGSVTTAQANELVIAGLASRTTAGTSVNNAWSGSFTERLDLRDSTDTVLVASAHRIVSAPGTYQAGSNLQGGSGNGATRCQTATFRAAF
jgi:hypothetical protein